MKGVTLTHVGGPTLLIEIETGPHPPWRLLTDPTFDPAGKDYKFGWGTGSTKLAGPSLTREELGEIDGVLLSHDHHDDNLDPAGRALLPTLGTVVTTVPGAKRLTTKDGLSGVRGLANWQTTVLEKPGAPSLEITATPCRHGPPGSHPIVGDVIGFALKWEGQEDGVLWVSGDTVLYDGVREVATRLDVDTAVLHLGGVRFPISGPLRYTMTAAEAVELVALIDPREAIPIHYEGWKHFREGRAAIEAELASAPPGVRDRFRWLPIGR